MENKETTPGVQICEALNCLTLTGENLNPSCYTVDFEGETKEERKKDPKHRTHKGRTLVGCKKTSEIPTSHATAFGFGAGALNTTGFNNTFFGFKAGENNKDGTNNTFFGYKAGGLLQSGEHNVFLGYEAGSETDGGIQNTPDMFGKATPLNYSTFVGASAGQKFKGSHSVFLGAEAGKENIHPLGRNIFVGRASGQHSTQGHDNMFLGAYSGAGKLNKGGGYNTFIGACSGYGVKTKEHKTKEQKSESRDNIFLGNFTGYNYDNDKNSKCAYEGLIPQEIEKNIKTLKQRNKSGFLGQKNIFIGHGAGAGALTTEENNIFMGFQAGFLNSTGRHNVFVGKEAGFHNTSADYNTFVGSGAGYHVSKGKDNKDLKAGADSRQNTFLGWQSGYGCIKWDKAKKECIDGAATGHKNVFIGARAGFQNTRGNRNVFIGNRTGRMYVKKSKKNVIVGAQAGRGTDEEKAPFSTGQSFFGSRAGRHSTGSYNTFLGSGAGIFNKKGDGNISIGFDAGAFSGYMMSKKEEDIEEGNNNIFIGASEEESGRIATFNPSRETFFGVGPKKDDHSGIKSAGPYTPGGPPT